MSGVEVYRLRPGDGPRLRALRLRALAQAGRDTTDDTGVCFLEYRHDLEDR